MLLLLGKYMPGFYCLDIITGNEEEAEEEEYENDVDEENTGKIIDDV